MADDFSVGVELTPEGVAQFARDVESALQPMAESIGDAMTPEAMAGVGAAGAAGAAGGGIGAALGAMAEGIAIIGMALEAASPILQESLDLAKETALAVFRPFGDLIGLLLRPFLILMWQYFLIPFYQTVYPKIVTLSESFGEFAEAIFPFFEQAWELIRGFFEGVWAGLLALKDALVWIWDVLKAIGGGIVKIFEFIGSILAFIISLPFHIIVEVLKGIWTVVGLIASGIVALIGFIRNIGAMIGRMISTLVSIPGRIIDGIMAFGRSLLENTIGKIPGIGKLLGLQEGGVTTQDVIALVHKNEAVIPLDKLDTVARGRGGGMGQVTINVSVGKVSNDIDMNVLAERIAREFRTKNLRYAT